MAADGVVRRTSRRRSRPTVSLALAALVTVVYLINGIDESTDLADRSGAFSFGTLGLNPVLVDSGQVHRILTANVLHVGWFDLLATLVSLLLVGTAIERRLGLRRYLGALLIIGLGAGTSALYFNPAISRAATGTAAAIGLVALAVVVAGRLQLRWPLLGVAGLLDVLVYFRAQSDLRLNAPIGGVLSGVVVALVLLAVPSGAKRGRHQVVALLAVSGLIVVLIVIHIMTHQRVTNV